MDRESSFIEDIKNMPVLYDTRRNDYRNPKLTKIAWCNIADKYGVQIHNSQRRWATLCDEYMIERQKYEKNPLYCTNWRYYKNMCFMRIHLLPKRQNTTETPRNLPLLMRSSRSVSRSGSQNPQGTPQLLKIPSKSKHQKINLKNLSGYPKLLQRAKNIINGYINKTPATYRTMSSKLLYKKCATKIETEDIIYSDMINAMLKRLPTDIKNEAKLDILNLVKKKQIKVTDY